MFTFIIANYGINGLINLYLANYELFSLQALILIQFYVLEKVTKSYRDSMDSLKDSFELAKHFLDLEQSRSYLYEKSYKRQKEETEKLQRAVKYLDAELLKAKNS